MHHPQFLLLLFLAWQALPCLGRPCDDALLQEVTSENTRSKAQERLLQEVGTQNLRQHHIKQPLQYMLELYVNLTHNASAIKGNTVRSFVDNSEYCDRRRGEGCLAGGWNKLDKREEKVGGAI